VRGWLELFRGSASGPNAASNSMGGSLVGLDGPKGKLSASELRGVKCYRCYSAHVDAVCHHCGRFVCHECGLIPRSWLLVDPVFAYLAPLPSAKLRKAVHCRDCAHASLNMGGLWLLTSVLVALIALIGLLVDAALAFSEAFILVAILLALSKPLVTQVLSRNAAFLHGFPLFCKTTVSLEETIKADFHIDTDPPYLSYSGPVEGTLRAKFRLTPADQERYQRAFPDVLGRYKNRQVRFHAGFVVLDTLNNVRKLARFKHSVVRLTANLTPGELADYCGSSRELELNDRPYEIQLEQVLGIDRFFRKHFPLLVSARLLKGGYCLQIILTTWRELKLDFPKSSGTAEEEDEVPSLKGKAVLDRMELTIPPAWKVIRTDGQPNEAEWKVIWRKRKLDLSAPNIFFIEFQLHDLDLTEEGGEHPYPAYASALELEHRLVTGSYEVSIEDWTVSGLHVARDTRGQAKQIVRLANGQRWTKKEDKSGWMSPVVKHKTIFTGKLTVDPAALSCQQVQTVSDTLDEAESQPQITDQERLLVAPTAHIVNAIVNALADGDVFIQDLVETPGYMKETRTGGHQMRYWEIRGRYYCKDSLQPVSLHLVISGEEPRHDYANACGNLVLQLNLRSYSEANANGRNTYAMLKKEHARFTDSIKKAAYRRRQVDYLGQRIDGWRQEEQVEGSLRMRFPSITEVAAVLIPNGSSSSGHVFFVANGNYSAAKQYLLEINWMVHERNDLPRGTALNADGVDKWQLLRELEERANGK
jgi:hypothetical protein